jgi:hypothetical protein
VNKTLGQRYFEGSYRSHRIAEFLNNIFSNASCSCWLAVNLERSDIAGGTTVDAMDISSVLVLRPCLVSLIRSSSPPHADGGKLEKSLSDADLR